MKILKKISDFIVDKRNYILILFILLSVGAAICSTKVNINNDISSYLPKNSETRIGINKMDSNIKELKESSFNLMFKGLKEKDKEKVYNHLTNTRGVSSVLYDKNSKDYNKNNYTLYIVNVKDTADSKKAKEVFLKIKKDYKDYDIYTSGDISDKNETVLSVWIVVLAVFCALIILIVMCDSYVEPFLFLAVILMAVLLNKGTNIIFNSVSNITSSISAILQMALSMDYSIMLMSRFSQAKKKEKNKVKAMKNALRESFLSISSSSITTIVGLLALVFMSFSIGKDLGFVLAKGVLLSLLCIFTCLPALILLFDKAIDKTQKKSPKIKLDLLGKSSYKTRFTSIFFFLVIFGLSFIFKGNLGILYTENDNNKIKDVFKENNQMAIIYNNKDEKIISDYCKSLENKKGVDEILCYGNTINEPLYYNEVKPKLEKLNESIDVDDYLLKILFYNYYNQKETNKMTFNEFVIFIQKDVYNNKELSKKLDQNTKNNINKLANFASIDNINKKRTPNEIATILEIDSKEIEDILILYSSKNINSKMTLTEFTNFINNNILNSKYASYLDSSARSNLKTLTSFTNKKTINTKIDSQKQAKLFNTDKNLVDKLYLYYQTQNAVDDKLSLTEFTDFTLNYVAPNNDYASYFNEDIINNLKLLNKFSNKNNILKQMNLDEFSNMISSLNINQDVAKNLLLLKYQNTEPTTKITFKEFIDTVELLKDTPYLQNQDVSQILNIKNTPLYNLPSQYSLVEMVNIINSNGGNISKENLYSLYNLVLFSNNKIDNWTISLKEAMEIIIQNKEIIQLNQDSLNKIIYLNKIMESSVNNIKYNYKELANFMSLDESLIKNIYSIYHEMNNTTMISPNEFVIFILNHYNDPILKGQINNSTLKQLQLLNKIMTSVNNNTLYNPRDMSSLLSMDNDKIKLIYALHDYNKNNLKLSLKEIVDFLLNDVVNDKDYSANFSPDKISKLNTINGIMNSTINNTKYTKNEMFGILNNLTRDMDSKMVDLLYMYYGSDKEYNDNWQLTLEQLVNYLNNNILKDKRFNDFIDKDLKKSIINSKKSIKSARDLLIGKNYSRVVINTKLDLESKKTFDFIKDLKNNLNKRNIKDVYLIGNSPMAYDMSQSFGSELNFITILTMIAIFVVVAITFKSLIIPLILVLLIQTAVYVTMGILSFTGGNVYFIALLIVQSILMGATIDYAILYTSYYLEHRKKFNVKESIIKSYNKSINTILTSSSILIIVTLIVSLFSSAICAKICKTLSIGTLCSALLILLLLPSLLALFDKFIIKKNNK